MSSTATKPDGCNCPDANDMLIRGEAMGTKPPCPVHDTPETQAMLEKMLKPRIEDA